MNLNQPHYTPKELAQKLNVSTKTVLRWIAAGSLASAVLPGGQHRIYLDAVDRMLAQNAYAQTRLPVPNVLSCPSMSSGRASRAAASSATCQGSSTKRSKGTGQTGTRTPA